MESHDGCWGSGFVTKAMVCKLEVKFESEKRCSCGCYIMVVDYELIYEGTSGSNALSLYLMGFNAMSMCKLN